MPDSPDEDIMKEHEIQEFYESLEILGKLLRKYPFLMNDIMKGRKQHILSILCEISDILSKVREKHPYIFGEVIKKLERQALDN
jgi:hypothetical protein